MNTAKYILSYKRIDDDTSLCADYVVLATADTKVDISRDLDTFYNAFMESLKRNGTFVNSSIYEDYAKLDYTTGNIRLLIRYYI